MIRWSRIIDAISREWCDFMDRHYFQSLAADLAAFRSRLVANAFYQKRAISGEVR